MKPIEIIPLALKKMQRREVPHGSTRRYASQIKSSKDTRDGASDRNATRWRARICFSVWWSMSGQISCW